MTTKTFFDAMTKWELITAENSITLTGSKQWWLWPKEQRKTIIKKFLLWSIVVLIPLFAIVFLSVEYYYNEAIEEGVINVHWGPVVISLALMIVWFISPLVLGLRKGKRWIATPENFIVNGTPWTPETTEYIEIRYGTSGGYKGKSGSAHSNGNVKGSDYIGIFIKPLEEPIVIGAIFFSSISEIHEVVEAMAGISQIPVKITTPD